MLILESDFIREFPIVRRISRDAEDPLIEEYIKRIAPVESLLDIGACSSVKNYASLIRPYVKEYEGIDIVHDPETAALLDTYYVGNANDRTINRSYDVVISVSVFEHCGLSTYKADHREEVIKLFKTCLLYAKKRLWLSFDIGQEFLTPNQHAPITKDIWDEMMHLTKNYKVKKRFLYTQGCQANHPWYEHEKEDVAFKIPYISYIGNQSIAILEIEK